MAAYAGSRTEKEDATTIVAGKGEGVKECDGGSLPPLSHELVFIQESFVSHAPELPVQHIVQDYSPIIKVPFPPNINAADLIRTDKNGQLLSRCTNKFLIYRNEYAKELRSHGYKLSMRKISSIAAACWKEEPEYVIRRYEEIAREVERIHMRLSMSGTPVVDEDIKKAAATSTSATTTVTTTPTATTGMTRDKTVTVSRAAPYDIGASLRKSRNALSAVRASSNAIPSPSPSPPLTSAMPRPPNASSHTPVVLGCYARPTPQNAGVTAANVRPVPSTPSSLTTTPTVPTTTAAITASSERSQQASTHQQQQHHHHHHEQAQQHANCANGVPLQDGGPPMAFGAYTSELLNDLCANIEAQQDVYNPLDAVYPSPSFTGDIIEQQQMSYEALLHSDVPSGWGWFVLDRRSH